MSLNHNFCVICNKIIICNHQFGLHLMQEHLDVIVKVFKKTPIEKLTKFIRRASDDEAEKNKVFPNPIKEEPTIEIYYQNDVRIIYHQEQILESDVTVIPPEEWTRNETYELVDGVLIERCNKIYEKTLDETNENLVEQVTSSKEEDEMEDSLSETLNNKHKDGTELCLKDNENGEDKDKIKVYSNDNRDNKTSLNNVENDNNQNQQSYNIKIQTVHSRYTMNGFNCEYCSKIFKTKDSLRLHKTQVHGPYRYQCFECNKEFRIKSKLLNHLETHKAKSPEFSCAVCDKLFTCEKFLRTHLTRTHAMPNYQCLTCNIKFKTRWSKTRHSRLHGAPPKHLCFACGQKFSLMYELNKHFVATHVNKQGNFKCSFCPMVFQRRFSLKRHLKNMHVTL